MSQMNPTRVVTGEVRLSYVNISEAKSIQGGKPKYSVSLIIPKDDTETLKKIERAIDAAIDAGIGKFAGKRPNKAALKLPLRDGDVEAYANAMFVSANSTTPPQVVDANLQPILDASEVYSGCYARVSVSFYAFNTNGNTGIACGVGNIQRLRDGEPLGGNCLYAEDDFEAFVTSDDFLN